MQRIRYFRDENNNLISRPITTLYGTAIISITPSLGQANVSVTSMIGSTYTTTGSTIRSRSLQVLKIKAKKMLVKMGAEFSDEIRGKKVHEPIGVTK